MIIVIASAKGGSGKSTSAMHLAEYLSRRRPLKKVVLMDADPDNETSTHWYERGEDWRFELCGVNDDPPTDFDALIVDSGAAPGADELAELLERADLLIIPSRPTAADLESAVTVASAFDADGTVKLLLTQCPPGRAKAGPNALASLQKLGLDACPYIIRSRGAIADACEFGATLPSMSGKPAKTAWTEYQSAFRWLLAGVNNA